MEGIKTKGGPRWIERISERFAQQKKRQRKMAASDREKGWITEMD